MEPTGERSDRTTREALKQFDLYSEARALRDVETFSVHGHRAKTLTRNDDLTIVLMALRRGTHIRDHQTEHATTLFVLRGRVRLGLLSHTELLGGEHMVTLPERTMHDLEAVEDSDILLIVGRSTQARTGGAG